MELTHLNKNGEAVMVDVSEKVFTERTAEAFARIKMNPSTLETLLNNSLKKGDGLATARIAGIMAAKKTFELIPLCHNIPIESIKIELGHLKNIEKKTKSVTEHFQNIANPYK